MIKQIPAGLRILQSHLSEIWLKDSLKIGPKFSVVKLTWHCQFHGTVSYRLLTGIFQYTFVASKDTVNDPWSSDDKKY